MDRKKKPGGRHERKEINFWKENGREKRTPFFGRSKTHDMGTDAHRKIKKRGARLLFRGRGDLGIGGGALRGKGPKDFSSGGGEGKGFQGGRV